LTGKAPSERLYDARIEKAPVMRQIEKYRISDIAYSFGYNNPKVFLYTAHETEAKYSFETKWCLY